MISWEPPAPDKWPTRYVGGEYEAVWAEMMRVGPLIRMEPCLTPALEVCREMVRRSAENLAALFVFAFAGAFAGSPFA
jgi:hypothetical protein